MLIKTLVRLWLIIGKQINMKLLLLSFFPAFFICFAGYSYTCHPDANTANSTTQETEDSIYTTEVDSVLLPSFTIQLKLSAKAEDQLKKTKESVIVSASVSGIPKDKTNKQYKQSGYMVLANKDKELTTGRTAVFNDVKVAKKAYEGLESKDVEILINVYSSRRTSANNILDCDMLQQPVSIVKKQVNVLKGKLIAE